MRGRPGAADAIDAMSKAVDDRVVDAIPDESVSVGWTEQAMRVLVVLGEQQLDLAVPIGRHVPPALTQRWMIRAGARSVGDDGRARRIMGPGPRVSIPEMGNNVNRRGFRASVHDADPADDVFGVVL